MTMNNDKIRQRVQRNYAVFTRDIDPDRLSDYLKQEGIISIEQWQDICAKNKTPSNRCRALLDLLLLGTNPKAFLVIRNVLEKENHHLLDLIVGDDLTEDTKTVQQCQVELAQIGSLKERLHEVECEVDKLQKKVAELETERDSYQFKEDRQSNKTQLTVEVKESESSHSGCATENDGYSDAKDRDSTVKHSESYTSAMHLAIDSGGYVREKIAPRRVVSFPDAMSVAENESYSVAEYRDSILKPSDGKSGVISAERYEPRIYLASDSGGQGRKQISLRRGVSVPDLASISERCSTEQNSANFKPSGSRTPFGSKQFGNIEYSENPYLIKEIKTRASKNNCKAIHGLAILDDELFIVSRVSSEIEVHDTDRFTLVRRVELKILEAPWDIVACKINKCLYIMNWTEDQSKAIIRIDPNGNLIKQWSTGSYCGRLSITQDSNIMLTAYNANKIVEYSGEGHFLREIKLSYKIAHPKHAIKLSIGRSLVIHGMGDDVQQRLCLLDTTGCVLTSFGGENGSDRERLHGPIYMAVDKAGSIFVAEYANSRVLLLSRSLKFMRVLLSKEKHGIRYLRSIHLDEANGRLFLVDNNYQEREKILEDGRVLVFNIKS